MVGAFHATTEDRTLLAAPGRLRPSKNAATVRGRLFCLGGPTVTGYDQAMIALAGILLALAGWMEILGRLSQ